MTSKLRKTRTIVKIVAALISMAFFLNAISGIMGAYNYIENLAVTPNDPQADDFQLDYTGMNFHVGIHLNNSESIYPMEDIVLGLYFGLATNTSDTYETIINTTSTNLENPTAPITVPAGEERNVTLDAIIGDFAVTIPEMITMFGLNATFDIGTLLGDGTLKAQLILSFEIKFAMKQYSLAFTIDMHPDLILGGF